MIHDDDLRVSVGDASGREGDSGTTLLTFTARLSEASDQYVTVDYETADGTAVGGADYDPVVGTITFPPGATSRSVTVAVDRGDRMHEDDETFTVNLTGGGATVADGQGVGTIRDDDGPPAVSVGDFVRKEGRRGRLGLYFVVTLSSPSGKEVSVNFATADGTARALDRDYIARAGTLVFAPGETRKTVAVTIMGDGRREADERCCSTSVPQSTRRSATHRASERSSTTTRRTRRRGAI